MLPKDIDPIVPGLPTDWKRSTNSTATSYLATVDTAVRHSGKASASLRFSCGSEAEPWTGLSQSLDASAYRGKRVRLSGWIKTADAGEALLWVRADAERRMVAFDNLQGRGARGTGDWKRYEVVIDIPESALILVYGPSLSGKGQAWFDDLTLEVVGKEIPVTATPIDAGKYDEYSKDVDRSSRTVPVNLGFENGVVK